MDIITLAQMKIRKDAFIKSSLLVSNMNKYGIYRDPKYTGIIDFLLFIEEGLPLPTGRWGNAIALALEINNYIAAEYLIENAKRLKLNTDYVVSELGGRNKWTLKDEYLYSQLTYDDDINDMEIGIDFESNALAKYIRDNKEANERLEKLLGITDEDKEIIHKTK